MYKQVFLIAIAVLSMGLTAGHVCSAQQAPTKIAVVDLQRCLGESKVGKKYKAEFTAKAEQAKGELEKKEAVLKELRESLEKQSLVLSPAGKAEKEKEYQVKVEAFKEQFKSVQQNLSRQDQEVTSKVMKDLQTIIREIGEAGGYTTIVERQEGGVLYFAKDADITDEVVRRYDQRSKD